jgi:hypothetical protein
MISLTGVGQNAQELSEQPQPLSDVPFDKEVGAYFDHETAVVSGVGLAFGHRER